MEVIGTSCFKTSIACCLHSYFNHRYCTLCFNYNYTGGVHTIMTPQRLSKVDYVYNIADNFIILYYNY